MTKSAASITVTLPRLMTGEEVMTVVKLAIEDGNEYGMSHFIAKPHEDDGEVFTVGQFSRDRHDQILVGSGKIVTEIHLSKYYRKVEVIEHSWPFGDVYHAEYHPGAAAWSVEKLANNLKRRLDDVDVDRVESRFPARFTFRSIVQKLTRRLQLKR